MSRAWSIKLTATTFSSFSCASSRWNNRWRKIFSCLFDFHSRCFLLLSVLHFCLLVRDVFFVCLIFLFHKHCFYFVFLENANKIIVLDSEFWVAKNGCWWKFAKVFKVHKNFFLNFLNFLKIFKSSSQVRLYPPLHPFKNSHSYYLYRPLSTRTNQINFLFKLQNLFSFTS